MLERLRSRREDKGFTLIELLIVIVILGILAAIVVFAVGTTGSNAAAASCKADAKSVETALEAFKAQNNSAYPSTLTSQSASGSGSWAPLLAGGGSGSPYLRTQPDSSHYTIWFKGNGDVLIGDHGASSNAGAANFDTVATACEDHSS